jgi:hypothetical protein
MHTKKEYRYLVFLTEDLKERNPSEKGEVSEIPILKRKEETEFCAEAN